MSTFYIGVSGFTRFWQPFNAASQALLLELAKQLRFLESTVKSALDYLYALVAALEKSDILNAPKKNWIVLAMKAGRTFFEYLKKSRP
jgi:hypothetical protein